jgi:uncharacterized protein
VRLLPRDERFFDLFTRVATLNVEAAKQLHQMLQTEEQRRGPIAEAIKRCEHQADELTHEVVSRLDRSFITPLDREDIHLLASRLDDILDRIDGRMEEEGDAIYHEWLARLFDGKTEALGVMKWKEIYDTLEKTLDQAEDVANVLESIAIKHS